MHHGGALANEPRAHAMQRQQIALLRGLDGDKAHRWPLYRFRDRLGIAIVVLVALQEGLDVLRRDQAHVVSECLDLAGDVMRATTGLEPDQAALEVGKPACELTARNFGSQHDGATLIETDEVERGLANIDADRGDRTIRRFLTGVHRRLPEL